MEQANVQETPIRSLEELRSFIEEKPGDENQNVLNDVTDIVEQLWDVVDREGLDSNVFTDFFWPNDTFTMASFRRLANRGTTPVRKQRINSFGQKFLRHHREIIDELKSFNRTGQRSLRAPMPRTRSVSENSGLDTIQVPVLVSGLAKSLENLQTQYAEAIAKNDNLQVEVQGLKEAVPVAPVIDLHRKIRDQQREIEILKARNKFLEGKLKEKK